MNDQKYPFEIREYYSPALNSLKRIYTQHPKFNGNTRLIYDLLFDHWNADYGYAFPTLDELAIHSGLSKSAVKTQIKTLIELELIRKRPSPLAGSKNDVYILLPPVTTREAFFEKFPEVEAKALERVARIKAEAENDKKRLGASNKHTGEK